MSNTFSWDVDGGRVIWTPRHKGKNKKSENIAKGESIRSQKERITIRAKTNRDKW